MNRLVILAPNWLGDAVMALPAIADVRRAWPRAEIVVAARPSIAPLFQIVTTVDGVADVEHLEGGFDTALLLPNSFRSALLAKRAGIPERWGYRTQWRAALLTRAIEPTKGLHQAEYYQHLVHALGIPNGPIEPRIEVSQVLRGTGARVLVEAGWDGTAPVVALAPGAAYGGAKRWPPESFASLARTFASDGVQCVMIGTSADVSTAAEVAQAFQARELAHSASHERRLVSLVGKTDLPTLAGVLANCRALVTNDSGAMHLAAACGVAVTAVFGPTDERATRPLGDGHTIITHPVWCRPCMLRECPLDHRCMLGIAPADVTAAARRIL
jgi:heptosyltransferase-2